MTDAQIERLITALELIAARLPMYPLGISPYPPLIPNPLSQPAPYIPTWQPQFTYSNSDRTVQADTTSCDGTYDLTKGN